MTKYLILFLLSINLHAASTEDNPDLYKTGLQASRDFLKAIIPTLKEISSEPSENREQDKHKLLNAARLNALNLLDKALDAPEPRKNICTDYKREIIIGLISVSGIILSVLAYGWMR